MKMLSKTRFIAVASTLCALNVALLSPANAKGTMHKSTMMKTGLNKIDQQFLKDLHGANLGEIAYAPTVMKQASSQADKTFAQMMVSDHRSADSDVKALAARKGVKLDNTVPEKEMAVIKRLGREHGAKFDKAYQHEMIRDHTADVGEIKREISLGQDPEVKALAMKVLPIVQGHLDKAKSMLPPAKMGMAKMGGSKMSKMAPQH